MGSVTIVGIISTGFGLLDLWIISSKEWPSASSFWTYIFTKDPNTMYWQYGSILLVVGILTLVVFKYKNPLSKRNRKNR